MPRRILYLTWAPFFSGAERALLLTLKSLDPSRYEPVVLVGTDGELLAQLRQAGLRAELFELAYLDRRRPWRWVKSVGAVVRHALANRAALVHANDMPSFQPGGYAARLLGRPAISHLRFPDEAAAFRWFFRPGLDRALFVSEYLRSESETRAPDVFAGRSDVLYDGVSVPPPPSPEAVASLKQSLGLAGSVVVALTGQVSEVKGIWDFVEAAAALRHADGPPALFAVLGDDLRGGGALLRAMKARVEALGLSTRFRFLGFRPDAPALIPAFDIVAVPSHVEPLGNATLEAMAAGRPVVGSRVGGIPEMVVDGETGLLVPARDSSRLAEALARLIARPEERARFGAAALERARSVFGLSGHAARLQAIYDGLIAPRHGTPGRGQGQDRAPSTICW